MPKEALFVDDCTKRSKPAILADIHQREGVRWAVGWADDGWLDLPAKAASVEDPPDWETRGVVFIPASGRNPQGSQDSGGNNQFRSWKPYIHGPVGRWKGGERECPTKRNLDNTLAWT